MSQSNINERDQSEGDKEKQITGQQMHEILPRLFLGELKAAGNIEELQSNRISFVLSIKHAKISCATREAYRKARISHVQIKKDDDPQEDLLSIFEPVCDMIEGRLTKGKAVLVHCALGKSRSTTVVMAYVMRHLNTSFQDSLDFVKTKRPVACPSPVFTEQLKVWEQCRFDLQNVTIVDQGPDFNLVGPSCTTEGKKGDAEGGDEAKQEAETIHEVVKKEEGQDPEREAKQEAMTSDEGLVKKEQKENAETGVARKGMESQKDLNGNEEEKSKDKDENAEENGGKADKQILFNTGSGFDNPSNMIVKSQKPQSVEDNSAADQNSYDNKDISATGSPTPAPVPTPAPELIRTAVKFLYQKRLAMGKKKLLRILKAEHHWGIGSKEFRSHLEAIPDRMETEKGNDGDSLETPSCK